jgi:hypothetical protein
MTEINRFRQLANRPQMPGQGRVVAVTAGFITLSVVGFPNQKRRRAAGDGTNYARGDTVYFDQQFVRGRVRASPEVYVL